MTLVLVHGILNTGHIMSWMRKRLEQQGYSCIAPTIAPFDGRKGIAHAAKVLQETIDNELGKDAPIILIGFSMGGLLSRYYMQFLGGNKRVKALFTIASPHHGSYLAHLPYPSKAFVELRPNSDLLQHLKAHQQEIADIPLFSFRSPMDSAVVPSRSSHWSIANNQVFNVPLHMSMIFSRRVLAAILTHLDKLGFKV